MPPFAGRLPGGPQANVELSLCLSVCVCVCVAVYVVQVVVDDDRVGVDLVRLLNKSGRGRVTFMPLNRLRVNDVAYPTQFGDKAVPLYRLLKCPDKYKKAVQQVRSVFVETQAHDHMLPAGVSQGCGGLCSFL